MRLLLVNVCLGALLLVAGCAPALPSTGPIPEARASPAQTAPGGTGLPVRNAGASGAHSPAASGPSPPCLTQVDYWENVTCNVKGGPSARAFAGFSADSSCSCALLFGGRTAQRTLADTWVFKDGGWTNVSRSGSFSPVGRSSMGLTFDSKHDYFLLFGGRSEFGLLGDTWNFSGGGWTNLTPSVPPIPVAREGATFTWDGAADGAILFGGRGMGGPLSDTWKFSSGGWSHLLPMASPSARQNASATYVPQLGGVLLFGGEAGANRLAPNDTWVFRLGNWTNLTTGFTGRSPPPRWGAALAYYPFFSEVLLLGGATGGNQALADEWTFDITGWISVQAVGPAPRVGAMMASLIVGPFNDGNLLLFGGLLDSQAFGSDLWRYGFYHPFLSTNPTVDAKQPLPIVTSVYGGFPPYALSLAQGDGNSSNRTIRTYVYGYTYLYASPGTYNLSMSVVDALGEAISSFVPVVVSPSLTAGLTANVSATDVGVSVAFVAAFHGGSAPYQMGWNFSDGNNSYQSFQVNRSFAQPGTYRATFLVLDGNFNGANATTQTVVHPLPRLIFPTAVRSTRVGTGALYNVSLDGGTPPFRVVWGFDDGESTTGFNSTHTWKLAGNHTVTVLAQDSVGVIVRGSFVVWVGPAPPTSGYSWAVPAGILGAVALAVVGWVLIRRNRRPRPPPPPAGSPKGTTPIPDAGGPSVRP